ncbi:MAG: hypothetical protein KF795_02300 [Labilithrix sp.]|nr:hypothetical protein [Labilithrix sp.]
MKARVRSALACVACLAAGACDGTRITEGLEEPFAVHDAQFLDGELPGLPPDEGTAAPRPTAATTETTVLRPGLPNVAFFGWATLDAVSVAARIEGQGSGYWVVPAGPPDPQVQGEPVRVWRFVADLHRSLTPGRHRLLVSALDDAGRAGNQVATSLCIHRRVPDNGNACDATKAPPEVAVSLEWDRPVDLDLVVVTPSGEAIAARSPAKGLGAEEKINRSSPDKNPPGAGYLDFDSNSGCRIDARQLENVVFQERPAPGSYLVYANLHDACGEPSVRYTVTRWARAVVDPAAGTYEVVPAGKWSGTAVAIQANGGTRLGTFVAEFFVP